MSKVDIISKKKIAFADPASFGLPYDRYFLNSISKTVDVDFFFSETAYSMDEIDSLSEDIIKFKFKVSRTSTNPLLGIIGYCRLILKIFCRRHKYSHIHFNWSVLPKFDKLVLPFLFGNKLIYTLHNLIPHDHKNHKIIHEHDLARRCAKLVTVSEYVYGKSKILNPSCYLFQHGLVGSMTSFSDRVPSRCVFAGGVKPYKGIERFIALAESRSDMEYYIYGKWSIDLIEMKERAENACNVVDEYLNQTEFNNIFKCEKSLIVLPYDDISQSGILYNIIAGCTPFIASKRGDFVSYAEKIGMKDLLFDPFDAKDIQRALNFCLVNHLKLKHKMLESRTEYVWNYPDSLIKSIY